MRFAHLRSHKKFDGLQVLAWTLAIIELAAIVANTNIARSLPASQAIGRAIFSTQSSDSLRVVPQAAIGAVLALLGGAIRAACYRSMGRHYILEVAIQKQHKLITDGPYSIVRHPGYTGGVMAVVGFCVFHTSPGSLLRESRVWDTNLGRIFVGLIIVVVLYPISIVRRRVQLEDNALRNEFGKDWDEWEKNVPYRLIPGVY